jgi:crossover junction endodeoxyribonuclease RuvC
MPIIAGLDPGLHGALGLYATDEPDRIDVWDLPKVKVTKRKKEGLEIDWLGFCSLLETIKKCSPDLVVIEAVHSMPKQGVASSFAFGDTFGGQRQLMRYILDCRIALVPPQTWKRMMKVGTSTDDIYVKTCAMFPRHKDLWVTPRGRILHDRCEAAMIAKYGQLILENKV